MRKRVLAICIVVLIFTSLPIYAMANTERTLTFFPKLSFEGTTAKCSVAIIGYTATDSIDAVIKLWYGTTCLETWTVSGTGYLRFDDTCEVTRNREYTLTVDAKINNISNETVSVSNRCE